MSKRQDHLLVVNDDDDDDDDDADDMQVFETHYKNKTEAQTPQYVEDSIR